MSLAEQFYSLFKGSDIAHGTYTIKSERGADGKKQGTAVSLEDGEFIKRHIQPDITILAHTMEDARQMAEELGLHMSGYEISCKHDFQREWVSTLREHGAAEALLAVEGLAGVSPSFEIVEGV